MPDAGRGFRLIHSNALDVLAGVLAERLRASPGDGDWLRPEIVLVPQFSMRRWLQQSLAESIGICANVRFLAPGEFVDMALDANLATAGPGDRLAPEVSRWHLLQALRVAPPADYAQFLADDDRGRKRWSLAVGLADTFEKYQAWRRDLLLRWEAGADPDDAQAQLWRGIASGRAHRARRIGAYLQRFGARVDRQAHDAPRPGGLPPRLFVFACQNVSPDVLQVIASQARAGTQEFFLHTPSRAFWGDLARWGAQYLPADDDQFLRDHSGAPPNPLLAAWGQAGRDFIATLASGEAVHADYEARGFVEPSHAHLLGRLQADVLDNVGAVFQGDDFHGDDLRNAAPGADWPRAQVDSADTSLQFHACHTPLREVQVLHDQLRALLEAPGSPVAARLDPRDIAVLAPDIDAYAPHIEAVFGGALGSTREIPYTLADTSPLATVPLAAAFVRVLELPLQPLTLGDALDLLAVPAIAQQFDVDDAQRGALAHWLQDAGARWGFDAGDRAAYARDDDAPTDPAYTFEFALDRLLLGYATGMDADVAGVAPWPGVEGQAAQALDAALRFLQVLRTQTQRLRGPLPPQGWADTIGALLDALVPAEPRDAAEREALRQLRAHLAAFAQGAALAGFDAPVEHAVLLDHLRTALGDADARAPFLSGGVCFGRMVPMRLIPFRVICLLGMDEAAFPGRDARDPLDRINRALDGRERRIGDPSRRDADRYLFLQLFASAGRVFYLSWTGMDARDGSAREPSSLVSELLDVAVGYHAGNNDAIREALVVRHALQPFSPAAFGAPLPDETQGDPRRFSFDARWQGAADAEPGRHAAPRFADADVAAQAADTTLTLGRLRHALMRPHAFYLQEGLHMRLPEEDAAPGEHEPFGDPAPLARHVLRQLVFDAWRRDGARPDPAVLHAHLLARAVLPPGADGRAALDAVLGDVAPFAAAAIDAGFGGAGQTRAFEVDVEGCRLTGTLDDVHDGRVFRAALRPQGRHGGHALRHGLDWLIASTQGLALHELSVQSKIESPAIVVRPPLDATQARETLASLLAARRRALRAPLPFLPKSAHVWWLEAAKSAQAGNDTDAAFQAAEDAWCGGGNGYTPAEAGHAEAGAATAIALRGCDPFLDGGADAREAFELWAQRLFDALEHGQPFDASFDETPLRGALP